MNILILNGSPRPQGHTKKLISAFCEGAKLADHKVTVVDACMKNIKGCLACEYCHTKEQGTCIQKDDMQEIYRHLMKAEMLVIASPIYYHGITGQLKCAIDRLYAVAYPTKPPRLKKAAMILSSGDPDMYGGALFSYQGDFLTYLGLENMGVYTAYGDQQDTPEQLQKLKEFGLSLT